MGVPPRSGTRSGKEVEAVKLTKYNWLLNFVLRSQDTLGTVKEFEFRSKGSLAWQSGFLLSESCSG